MSEEKHHTLNTWRLRAFGVSWRLALLVLPWQTRWFADASLAGWPWEQGRWAIYASWMVLLAAILTGWKAERQIPKVRTALPIVLLIVLTLVTTLSRVATAQWWIQVILLGAFVVTLWRRNVSRTSVLAWFAGSLLPHAVLAVRQYLTGTVMGSTWLGMAAHAAKDLGASVVQHDDVRILRAYGGFPHPNILGAWMAAGMLAALECVTRARSKYAALVWSLATGSFSAVLVTSYSRSAWLGAAMGLIAWAVVSLRSRRKDGSEISMQFAMIGLLCVVCFSGAAVVSQRAHIFARVDLTQRLEARSVDRRAQSLADGWSVFMLHPFFGAGPNAELVDLASRIQRSPALAPLEPPHDVPLLVLADLGVVGLLFFMWLVWSWRPRLVFAGIPYLLVVVPPLLFDHLLFSYWSGQALAAILVFVALKDRRVDTNADIS